MLLAAGAHFAREAGFALNPHVNALRDDDDRLKAILTNCLRRLFESIAWPPPET